MKKKLSIGSIEYLLHLFLFFIIQNPNPLPPTSAADIKRQYYLLKLMGLIWFDDVENKSGLHRSYYLNFDWPSEPISSRLTGLVSLDTSTLEWLSNNIQRPEWAVEDHIMKNFSFTEFWQAVSGNTYEE